MYILSFNELKVGTVGLHSVSTKCNNLTMLHHSHTNFTAVLTQAWIQDSIEPISRGSMHVYLIGYNKICQRLSTDDHFKSKRKTLILR